MRMIDLGIAAHCWFCLECKNASETSDPVCSKECAILWLQQRCDEDDWETDDEYLSRIGPTIGALRQYLWGEE